MRGLLSAFLVLYDEPRVRFSTSPHGDRPPRGCRNEAASFVVIIEGTESARRDASGRAPPAGKV